MNKAKEILITGFALFSLFFGAGNLLLPPLLGYNAGSDWVWVTLGFLVTAVVIPVFGILAHAKLQGTMYDFGKQVSPIFSSIYCVLVYAISLAIPSPRTAAATHEIAIFPYFETSSLLTSTVYFVLVLVFVLNRSIVLHVIGKYLTPFIVAILILVIGIGLFSGSGATNVSGFSAPIVSGILEGYQTFDAIGAVVVGGVVIISLQLKGFKNADSVKSIIKTSGFIAGFALFLIYAGLIAVGAFYGKDIFVDGSLSNAMQRATLLRGISTAALGNIGNAFLSVLIALACFTTAVGIITGAADYFKGIANNATWVYRLVAVLGCAIGIGFGQLDFHTIITVALPVLMLIYPVTIVLILLNVLPENFANPLVFKAVVFITIIFSIPDVLGFIIAAQKLEGIKNIIPLANQNLGWVLPAFLTFVLLNLKKITTKN